MCQGSWGTPWFSDDSTLVDPDSQRYDKYQSGRAAASSGSCVREGTARRLHKWFALSQGRHFQRTWNGGGGGGGTSSLKFLILMRPCPLALRVSLSASAHSSGVRASSILDVAVRGGGAGRRGGGIKTGAPPPRAPLRLLCAVWGVRIPSGDRTHDQSGSLSGTNRPLLRPVPRVSTASSRHSNRKDRENNGTPGPPGRGRGSRHQQHFHVRQDMCSGKRGRTLVTLTSCNKAMHHAVTSGGRGALVHLVTQTNKQAVLCAALLFLSSYLQLRDGIEAADHFPKRWHGLRMRPLVRRWAPHGGLQEYFDAAKDCAAKDCGAVMHCRIAHADVAAVVAHAEASTPHS